MTVTVGEVEVIPERPATRGDGASAGASESGASMNPAELEVRVLAIIRRETARMERLWAD